MSTLRASFRQTNALQISVVLNAVTGELAALESALDTASDNTVKMALLARKRQLLAMKADLQAQSQQGQKEVAKNDDFAVMAALVHIYLARQSAEQANRVRQVQLTKKKVQHYTPKFAA